MKELDKLFSVEEIGKLESGVVYRFSDGFELVKNTSNVFTRRNTIISGILDYNYYKKIGEAWVVQDIKVCQKGHMIRFATQAFTKAESESKTEEVAEAAAPASTIPGCRK